MKMESKEHNETSNPHTEVTISRPIKVLHFCDGVEEEIEEEKVAQLKNEPHQTECDPKTLSWGPWFSYYAWKSGTKVLNGIDYAGESLSNFFGITTPKYQIEINEYERVEEEKKQIEEESAGWVPRNAGGDIPLVLNEPSREMDKPSNV